MIENVDYHIIDRCNLNCASCNHFSPLVPSDDKGKSIEQITADLTLLSKVKGCFNTLSLLGGEPTLHPELSKILRIARQIMPDKEIHLVTNGTRYNMFEKWMDSIIENDIWVMISLYPYCDDYENRIRELTDKFCGYDKIIVEQSPDELGFNYGFLSNRDDAATEDDIKFCNRPYFCAQVKNGKLYICHFAAQFDRLKDYFGDKITFEMDGKEYLDLNGDITEQDVCNFVDYARPNICYHCVDVVNKNAFGERHDWGVTKKDLNEWMAE